MIRVLAGHVLDRLRELPDESVHCVVTSPPYYGLRAYGTEPQIWGGDRNCRHLFGVEQKFLMGRGDAGRPATTVPRGAGGEMIPSGYSAPQKKTTASNGAFCNCGAWRGDLGLEPTLDLCLDHLIEVFGEIWRVLRRDGTVWLNIGDSYAGSWVRKAGARRQARYRVTRSTIIRNARARPARSGRPV